MISTLIFGFLACLCMILPDVIGDRVVMTNNGPVQGITVAQEIEAYLGIPYAEPPVGRLRFQKPVPKTPWNGVFDATTLAVTCSQMSSHEHYYSPDREFMTEDCLQLNIWVPQSRQTTQLKHVLVYLHGGAFNQGSSNLKVYDGTVLAHRGDIIVVTINYRVGVLGFFTSLTDHAVGNFGAYDQLLAIQWIKDNIRSFGGDPENMVAMGESAGSMSITGHLVSPLSRNNFKRVIIQSGTGVLPIILDKNRRIFETSQKLARLVGCADDKTTLKSHPRIVVSCLRRLSDKALIEAENKMSAVGYITFYPRTGDKFLPETVIHSFIAGRFQNREMLIGVNEEEGTLLAMNAMPQFLGHYGQNNVQTITKRLAKQLIFFIFKNTEQVNEKEIADYYISFLPNGTSDAYTKLICQAIGDYFVMCNSIYTAEIFVLRNNPVYFYVLTRRPSSTPLADWMGVTHFDEVQYTFGNPLFENFTAEELKLSNRIMDRWIAFVKTGNPNIPNEIEWPKFTMRRREYLEINDEESIHTKPDNDRCEFWRERHQAIYNETVLVRQQRSTSSTTVHFIPYITLFVFVFNWAIVHF